VAVLLTVLLGFAALVVDLGALFKTKNELQNASDSAALAGAMALDRTAAGVDRARTRVLEYGLYHDADASDVVIASGDVIFGNWDASTRAFTADGPTPADPAQVNAVQVISRRAASQGDAVDLSFGVFVGQTEADVSADAIGVGGGPCAECSFPLVVPDCALETPLEDGTCDYCMVFQSNNTDNAGWTSFDVGNVGVPVIQDLIEEACYVGGAVSVDPATGLCGGNCRRTSAGTPIQVTNGNNMNTGNANFCPTIQDILLRGDPDNEPVPFVVRVPVLQSTSGTCDAAQFSGTKTIAGYATMEILGAKCGNSDPGVIAPSAPCATPASDKYVVAVLRCDVESDNRAGCGYFGIDTNRVRLVE
jgi:hypothetical protein